MSKNKARLTAFLFMAMFLAILIFISIRNPGAINIISYCFAVPGVIAFTRVLYIWLQN